MSRLSLHRYLLVAGVISAVTSFASSCGAPAGNVTSGNTNIAVNTNINANTFNSNVNANSSTAALSFTEPQTYQGVISLTLQTVGDQQQTASMPPLKAVVARNGTDRAMEFTLPTNEKVIYIEKAGVQYVVLPSRRQYAELTSEALGFEVRRLMMPEQIVNQLKAIPGARPAGEETVNGRVVQKYVYGSAANTGTQAGTVETESYFLIDKETGLPLRSETVSQSTSGGNVQGVKGVRLLTEMSDLKPTPDANVFNVPTDFQKIDPEQVKAQANLIFNAAAAVIGQLINQAQAPKVSPTPAANTSPAANR